MNMMISLTQSTMSSNGWWFSTSWITLIKAKTYHRKHENSSFKKAILQFLALYKFFAPCNKDVNCYVIVEEWEKNL